METFDDLRKSIMAAFPKAAEKQDVQALTELSAILAEMEAAYSRWKERFSQLETANDSSKEKPAVIRDVLHSRSEEEMNNTDSSNRNELSFSGNTDPEDFTGKSIRGFSFCGATVPVDSFAEMLSKLTALLVRDRPDRLERAMAHVRGRRPYLSHAPDLTVSREVIPGLYVETNHPANQAVKVARDLVRAFGYPPDAFTVEVLPFRTRAVKRTARSRGVVIPRDPDESELG